MIRFFAAAAISLAFALPAAAEPATDWMDGVFAGNVEDFFVDQTPAIKAFVHAHLDLASDAASHLQQCPAGDDGCSLGQIEFILDYISAFYNDNNSQDNVASLLAGDDMPPKFLLGNDEEYMVTDPVLGCAWRIATLLSDATDISDGNFLSYQNDCQSLSSDDQSQAHGDAVLIILPKIHAAMAKGTIPYDLVDDYPQSP